MKIGFHTTILSTSDITTGYVVVENKDSINTVEEIVKSIFKERIEAEETNVVQTYDRLRFFYEDSQINPVIQHALYNHSFSTWKTQFVQDYNDLDPEGYVADLKQKSEKGFSGFYQYHYLDAKKKKVAHGIMYVNPSGRAYMYVGERTFYLGFFQIVQNSVVSLRFDYKQDKRFHRLSITISLDNYLDSGYLYGVYSAIEQGQDLPIYGRIRFTKLNCNNIVEAVSLFKPGSFKLDIRKVKSDDTYAKKGEMWNLWMFIIGKFPIDDPFGESLYYWEALLRDQNFDLTSTKFIIDSDESTPNKGTDSSELI